MNLLFYVLNTSYQSLKNNYSIKIKIYFSIISYLFIISFYILSIFSIFFLFTQFGRKIFFLKNHRRMENITSFESHCSVWLLVFPLLLFLPPFSSSRDSIAARPACAVVFHCCERMQIAIPVPGPSINSNRINSSAVIVFCASQKTLYTRAASFCPATNNIRFIRTVAHVADLSSPRRTDRLVCFYG